MKFIKKFLRRVILRKNNVPLYTVKGFKVDGQIYSESRGLR